LNCTPSNRDTPEGTGYRVRVVSDGEQYVSQTFTTAEERDAFAVWLASDLAGCLENPRIIFTGWNAVGAAGNA
jgi:hypothetical protein